MSRKQSNHRLQVIHPDCAGIDVGQKRHDVAVDPGRCADAVRSFGCCTDDLVALAAWLAACGVRMVAMEATGVYWIPIDEVLDRAGFEVHLVNLRATRQVSGRKSDVLDSQWIQQLMSYGLLKGAFRPSDQTCVLRAYVRQRSRLGQDASRSVQHVHKALTEMNVQIETVLSDVMGKTGQQILRAIVAGERDPSVLAQYRDRRVKADLQTLTKSLMGNWREEHLFALAQAFERYDFLHTQINACEQQIAAALDQLAHSDPPGQAPEAPARTSRERVLQSALYRMLGVDLTAIPCIGVETALVIAAEIGADLSRLPSSEHFCSWLTLAPGTRISGDKPLKGPPVKRGNRAGQALRVAASTARHSRSFIGAAHRARLTRLDIARAIKATAHHLARLIYVMLTRGQAYVEKELECFETEHRDRQIRNLHRKPRQLGYAVAPDPQKSAA